MSGAGVVEPNPIGLFVCGVQKGGTTSMDGYLRQHPQLSPPHHKELHLFDDEAQDWTGGPPLAIGAHYPPDDKGQIRYDCTPIYGFWPQSLERIKAYNPAARLVFLWRDPFARAWSQWCMEYARGAETLPFAEAIRAGRQRLAGAGATERAIRHFSYVERGQYGAQAQRALALFPREQILWLRSVDLARDHQTVLARVADFLKIAPFAPLPARRDHANPQAHFPARPSRADRELIMGELAEEMALFGALSGLELEEEPV